MPAASAHIHPDEAEAEAAGVPHLHDRPINLVDIGRVLGESAKADRLGDISIRAWRDDLTVIRDSLSYARAILAADVVILSESGLPPTPTGQEIVDELPGLLTAPAPDAAEPDARRARDTWDVDRDVDEDVFVRTDHLLAAHRALAQLDLSSAAARTRALRVVEEQLAMLTERQATVEARLQQIKAVIFRRYRDGVASVHDRTA